MRDEIMTVAQAYEALEEIKKRHREDHSGGCRLLSTGLCVCTLCICDRLHQFIKERANATDSK